MRFQPCWASGFRRIVNGLELESANPVGPVIRIRASVVPTSGTIHIYAWEAALIPLATGFQLAPLSEENSIPTVVTNFEDHPIVVGTPEQKISPSVGCVRERAGTRASGRS